MDKVKLAVNSSGEIINCDEARFGMMTHVKYQEELKQARNDAREEAAKVADSLKIYNPKLEEHAVGVVIGTTILAANIRALKEK